MAALLEDAQENPSPYDYVPKQGSSITVIGRIPTKHYVQTFGAPRRSPLYDYLTIFHQHEYDYGVSNRDYRALHAQLDKITDGSNTYHASPAIDNLVVEYLRMYGVKSKLLKTEQLEINHDSAAGALIEDCRNKRQYLERLWPDDDDYFESNFEENIPLWTISQKDEVLSLEKISNNGTRVFQFSNTPAYLFESRLCAHFNKSLYAMGASNSTYFAPGLNIYTGSYNALARESISYKHVVEVDLERFDKRTPAAYLLACRDIRVRLYEGPNPDLYKRKVHRMYRWLTDLSYHLLPTGQIVHLPHSQKSGGTNTTPDNCLVHLRVLFDFCYTVLRKRTLHEIRTELGGRIYSDDGLPFFKTGNGMTPEELSISLTEHYAKWGYSLKFCKVQNSIIGLTFLGFKFQWYGSFVIGKYDIRKLTYVLLHDMNKLDEMSQFTKISSLRTIGVFSFSPEQRKVLYDLQCMLARESTSIGAVWTDEQLRTFWTGAEMRIGLVPHQLLEGIKTNYTKFEGQRQIQQSRIRIKTTHDSVPFPPCYHNDNHNMHSPRPNQSALKREATSVTTAPQAAIILDYGNIPTEPWNLLSDFLATQSIPYPIVNYLFDGATNTTTCTIGASSIINVPPTAIAPNNAVGWLWYSLATPAQQANFTTYMNDDDATYDIGLAFTTRTHARDKWAIPKVRAKPHMNPAITRELAPATKARVVKAKPASHDTVKLPSAKWASMSGPEKKKYLAQERVKMAAVHAAVDAQKEARQAQMQISGKVVQTVDLARVKRCAMQIVGGLMNYEELPVERYAQGFENVGVATAALLARIPYVISGTSDQNVLLNPDAFFMFRRNPFASIIYYEPNIGGNLARYVVNFLHPVLAPTGFDNAPSLTGQVLMNNETRPEFAYATSVGPYSPHGPRLYPMKHDNVYYFPVSSGSWMNIQFTTGAAGGSIIARFNAFTGDGDVTVQQVQFTNNNGSTFNANFQAPFTSYYTVSFSSSTNNIVDMILVMDITNYGKNSSTTPVGASVVAHLPAEDIPTFAQNTLGIRTVGVSGMFSNFANTFTVQGSISATIVPGNRLWCELLDTKDGSKLTGIPDLKILKQTDDDNGCALWVPVNSTTDFELDESVTHYANGDHAASYDIIGKSEYGLMYYTNYNNSTINGELYDGKRIEFETQNASYSLDTAQATAEEWTQAVLATRTIPTISANPLHLATFVGDLARTIADNTMGVAYWVQKAADKLAKVMGK